MFLEIEEIRIEEIRIEEIRIEENTNGGDRVPT